MLTSFFVSFQKRMNTFPLIHRILYTLFSNFILLIDIRSTMTGYIVKYIYIYHYIYNMNGKLSFLVNQISVSNTYGNISNWMNEFFVQVNTLYFLQCCVRFTITCIEFRSNWNGSSVRTLDKASLYKVKTIL